ncbi:UNVERIFIED_ORG: hypothetical protein BDU10_3464 [Burkholderia sp. CF145]
MTDILRITVENQDVSLPVARKSLGDFISGLLGQPQTLEKKAESAFSIDHTWLIHLISLITQRVAQQNLAEPLTFEATISYRGGFSRKVSTFPAFEHFSETQNVVCVGVKLDISLLIQFPGKDSPEKQQVTISFKTNEKETSLLENLFSKTLPIGQCDIEIRHTERTWADDILNLVNKELELVQTPEASVKKFLRRIFLPFAGALFPMFVMGGMVLNSSRNSGTEEKIIKRIGSLLNAKSTSPELLNEKLDTLLMHAQSQIESQGSGRFVVALLISVGIGAFVMLLGAAIAQPAPSFILISKASEKNKIETEKKMNRRLLSVFGSLVLTVVLGLAVNYIYDKLK